MTDREKVKKEWAAVVYREIGRADALFAERMGEMIVRALEVQTARAQRYEYDAVQAEIAGVPAGPECPLVCPWDLEVTT